jgi:hypothetical protein
VWGFRALDLGLFRLLEGLLASLGRLVPQAHLVHLAYLFRLVHWFRLAPLDPQAILAHLAPLSILAILAILALKDFLALILATRASLSLMNHQDLQFLVASQINLVILSITLNHLPILALFKVEMGRISLNFLIH